MKDIKNNLKFIVKNIKTKEEGDLEEMSIGIFVKVALRNRKYSFSCISCGKGSKCFIPIWKWEDIEIYENGKESS